MSEEDREILVEPRNISFFEEIPCSHKIDDPDCCCWKEVRTKFQPFSHYRSRND